MTNLELAIRSQPAKLERLATRDFAPVAARIEGRPRVWLVGTGSSQHVADLGALLLAEAGLDARWSGSSDFVHGAARPQPSDAVIVVSHTARTSFAVAAREAAQVLAEGYGSEYLLHGFAAPLQRGDSLLLLHPATDRDGLLPALGRPPGPRGSTSTASTSLRSSIPSSRSSQ